MARSPFWLSYCIAVLSHSTIGSRFLPPTVAASKSLLLRPPAPTRFAGFQRQAIDMNICGYLDGDSGKGIVCGDSYREYCNLLNDLSVVACCQTAKISSNKYNPLGCAYYSTCVNYSDLPQDLAQLHTADHSGDFTGTCYCTEPRNPYCQNYDFTNIGYSGWSCGSDDGIHLTLSAALELRNAMVTTSGSSKSTSAPAATVTAMVTATVTTMVGYSFQDSDTDPPNRTGAIVGGVFGSIAACAFLVVACVIWRRRSTQNAVGEPSTNPSFKVLTSDLLPLPAAYDDDGNLKTISSPIPIPHVTHEADGSGPPLEPYANLTYQKYRPLTELSSTPISEPSNRASFKPVSAVTPSGDTPSYTSLVEMPASITPTRLSEMGGRSVTPVLPEARAHTGSRVSDHDEAVAVRNLSGTVPEWDGILGT